MFERAIMNNLHRIVLAALVLVGSASAFGGELSCTSDAGNIEELRYSWRLRGGIRFIAGLVFPTTGVGNMRTTFPVDGAARNAIHSELLITAPNGRQGGFYAYESEIDGRDGKTLETYHGYEWGKKARHERTVFDYGKRLARIRKETPEEKENRVKPLPGSNAEFRDVLTAIYFLRQNAHSLQKPLQTSVFSDGKEYPVIFRPAEAKSFVIDGRNTPALGFEIVDAPGGKKWPGGVKVWLTNDARRIPVRIEIAQSIASLQLDLKKIESCTSLLARR